MVKTKISLTNSKLMRRLWAAVALISLFPLIVFYYFVSHIYISGFALLVLVVLVFLGWWILFDIFKTVEEVCLSSQEAAKDFGLKPKISMVDEVQQLESIVGTLVREHQRLAQKVEDLSMFEPITGLYNQKFFFTRLAEEIKRATAYQRPCGYIALELANIEDYIDTQGQDYAEKIIKKIVNLVKENVRPIDVLGMLASNRIGIIIVERNRRQSQYLGLKLMEAIGNALKLESTLVPKMLLAVAESPIDGTDVKNLKESVENQLSD